MLNARSSPVDKPVSFLTDPDPDSVQVNYDKPFSVQVKTNTSAVNPVSGPVNYNTERSQKVTTKIKKVHVIIGVTALLLWIIIIGVLSFEISKLKYEIKTDRNSIQTLEKEIKTDRNSIQTLEKEIKTDRNSIQTLEKEIKTDRNSIQTLEKEVKDLTHKLSTVKSVFFSAALSSDKLLESYKYGLKKNLIIVFDMIWANEGDAYNKSTGNFDAPCDGFFQFTISALSQRNESFILNLMHEDKIVVSVFGGEVGWHGTTNTAILKLAKGDWVNVQSAETNSYLHPGVQGRNYHAFTGNMLKEL